MRLLGVVLIVLGTLAAVYGGFWYTTEETKAELGPVKVEVQERKRVNIPLWAGVASIAAGTLLLVSRKGGS